MLWFFIRLRVGGQRPWRVSRSWGSGWSPREGRRDGRWKLAKEEEGKERKGKEIPQPVRQYRNSRRNPDLPSRDDITFARGDSELIVDDSSIEFLRGATVDFAEDLLRSSFAVINNPNSASSCGCGSSFMAKDWEE